MAVVAEPVSKPKPKSLARFLPILAWLPAYKVAWLGTDLVAGLTVVALLIPEGMAYAQIAGVPPEAAFYAAPIGLLMFAIFGTSRQLVVAVSSAIAAMSFATVSEIATPNTTEFIMLTAGLAMLAGLVSILAGLLRLGRVAQFFSESVMVGFITGLALIIIVKQLPKLFGIEGGAGNSWERLHHFAIHLPQTHLPALLTGLLCLALLILLERFLPRIPAALVALVFGIGLSLAFGLEARGVEVVGELPAGLAAPQLPAISPQQWLLLLPGALGLSLVCFAEAIGPSRAFAAAHKYEIDPNQEWLGVGASNFGAGLFQGFPIGASLSKSAANDQAGRAQRDVRRDRSGGDRSRRPLLDAVVLLVARAHAGGDRHRRGVAYGQSQTTAPPVQSASPGLCARHCSDVGGNDHRNPARAPGCRDPLPLRLGLACQQAEAGCARSRAEHDRF